MTITERTLKQWRKEALRLKKSIDGDSSNNIYMGKATMQDICSRLLRMTQELLDLHLMRK